eukprot:874231-Prorocentrum_minimum.AAC.1
MPQPRNAKAWNEDLVRAFRTRENHAIASGSASHHRWRQAAEKIESLKETEEYGVLWYDGGGVLGFNDARVLPSGSREADVEDGTIE